MAANGSIKVYRQDGQFNTNRRNAYHAIKDAIGLEAANEMNKKVGRCRTEAEAMEVIEEALVAAGIEIVNADAYGEIK